MATVLDSITAIATADAAVASAQSGLAAAQAAVTTAQTALTSAQAADTAADQQLSADLHSNGPVFVTNQDGTATLYQYDASASTGFDAINAKPAGSVTSTAPTPSPSPIPPTPSSTS